MPPFGAILVFKVVATFLLIAGAGVCAVLVLAILGTLLDRRY
jgi:hypothetical protein